MAPAPVVHVVNTLNGVCQRRASYIGHNNLSLLSTTHALKCGDADVGQRTGDAASTTGCCHTHTKASERESSRCKFDVRPAGFPRRFRGKTLLCYLEQRGYPRSKEELQQHRTRSALPSSLHGSLARSVRCNVARLGAESILCSTKIREQMLQSVMKAVLRPSPFALDMVDDTISLLPPCVLPPSPRSACRNPSGQEASCITKS